MPFLKTLNIHVSDPNGVQSSTSFTIKVFYSSKQNIFYAKLPDDIVAKLNSFNIQTDFFNYVPGFIVTKELNGMEEAIKDIVKKLYSVIEKKSERMIEYQIFCINYPYDREKETYGEAVGLQKVNDQIPFCRGPVQFGFYAYPVVIRTFINPNGEVKEKCEYMEEPLKEKEPILYELLMRSRLCSIAKAEQGKIHRIPYSDKAALFFLGLWDKMDRISEELRKFEDETDDEALNDAITGSKFMENFSLSSSK